MITQNDWDAAAEEFMAAERERLGGPPTPEEVIAYSRGELSEAVAERVRALLVCYPDLSRVLVDPAPPRRISFSVARVLPIAASVLLALFAALSQWQVQRLTRALDAPHVHDGRHELMPMMQRRGPSTTAAEVLPAHEKSPTLVLIPSEPRTLTAYRITIVDARGKERWSSSIAPREDGSFELSLPRKSFGPGTYRIRLHGGEELLDTYAIRIP